MADDAITALERRIGELTAELNALRKDRAAEPVPDYTFKTTTGETTLRTLFGQRDKLLVIHNMGQGCRYCTVWADGFNGLLPHLEDAMAVVLVSKDPPERAAPVREFARLAFPHGLAWRRHGGGDYIQQQGVFGEAENYPGAVVYERQGNAVLRKNACVFGPGDLYCALWPFLGLAGIEEWTPQYHYWRRPDQLDDGGANLLD